jgi:hypothetical protein
MQTPSDSSVALDAQVKSAAVALPLTIALFSLPTIHKTEPNNKVVINHDFLLILRSFADRSPILLSARRRQDLEFARHRPSQYREW